MRGPLIAMSFVLFAAEAAALTPEAQLALQHLREGERARAEAVLGDLDAVPLYLGELELDPVKRRVRGQLRLRVVAPQKGLDRVPLRLTPNAFGPDRAKLEALTSDRGAIRIERPEPSLMVLHLAEPLAAGEVITIRASLEAVLPRAVASGLLSGASGSGGDHGAFAASPEVLSAVGILPGIAEPGHAAPSGIGDLASYAPANYLISLTVPRGWRALATGVALGEVPRPDGAIRFSYGAALVREFPVFAVQGYDRVSRTVDGVTVESHYGRGMQSAGKRALEMAADALAAMEQRLGKLPWKVLRVVEVPLSGGAGGMEFPGLVTISSDLYRMSRSSTDGGLGGVLAQLQEQLAAAGLPANAIGAGLPNLGEMMAQSLDFTVAHEIAHQYFACLVGSDPVGAPTADEPLAQHLALRALEWTRGAAAADAMREGQLRTGFQMYRMTGAPDGPAARATGAFDNPLQYAALVYSKAPFLHDAERKLLGDDVHLAGLRAYVDRYRHRWACAECLTEVLAERTPRRADELRKLRRRYLQQAHGDEDLGKVDFADLLRGAGGARVSEDTLKLLEALLQAGGGP